LIVSPPVNRNRLTQANGQGNRIEANAPLLPPIPRIGRGHFGPRLGAPLIQCPLHFLDPPGPGRRQVGGIALVARNGHVGFIFGLKTQKWGVTLTPGRNFFGGGPSRRAQPPATNLAPQQAGVIPSIFWRP
jgi:hypothetical protein